MNETRTTGRWRTPPVILIILVYLIGYISAVVWIMERLTMLPFWAVSLLYLLFGLVWIIPLGPLIRWSSKDPNSQLKNPD